MSVAHPAFVVVALAAIAGVRLFPRIARGRLLLVLSLVFVTIAVDMVSLVALGTFILIGFACVRFGTGIPGRLAMPAMVTVIVGVFWLLKAGGFQQQVSGNLLGLSYVMFRILHLLVDVRERALPGPPRFASYVGYLLFFPNFLAGPIQRYEQFERQFVEPVPPSPKVRRRRPESGSRSASSRWSSWPASPSMSSRRAPEQRGRLPWRLPGSLSRSSSSSAFQATWTW